MIFNINFTVPVIFGEGTSRQTGRLLKENGVAKVFCIFDRGVKAAGLVDKITGTIKAQGIKVVEFDGVISDPPDTIVDAAGELARKERVDGVLGIGGGSSLDAAKAVNVLLGNSGSIRDYFGKDMLINPAKPLYLIPTTAGTGSEVTAVAVLTDTVLQKKQAVINENCFAALAIVDPSLTLGLPAHITAATGMDTFAHAVEAFTGTGNNPMTDLLAIEAVALTARYLPLAVTDGSNAEARYKMSFASLIAGMAVNKTFPHLGHAVGQTVGALYHIPHGNACGVVIPGVLEFIAPVVPDRVRAVGEAMGLDLRGVLSGEKLGSSVAARVRELMRQIELPSLKDFHIPDSALPLISTKSLELPAAVNCPQKADAEDVLRILQREYLL